MEETGTKTTGGEVMKGMKISGITMLVLFAAGMTWAATWKQDVSVGAKWSEAGNWTGGVPTSSDTAIFNQTQANTFGVDVDIAGQTRLLQVQQDHTFSGSGSISVTAAPTSHFQNIMFNTANSVTYNVPVSVKTTTAFYGQSRNSNGGTTTFNSSYTLESGSLLNFDLGTRVFNGDLTIDGSLRLGSGSMVIGGSGTTTISSAYINTAGAGTELHLNRTGAYTLSNPSSGYLRVEKSKIYFGADQALGAGTDVWLYKLDAASALISSGDFNQDFGVLKLLNNGGAIDMGNTASIWTFADSSAESWASGLTINNVDINDTVIRFAIGGGTGLTDTQIGQITLNGTSLAKENTTIDSGYLYITQAIPEPATIGLFGVSALAVLLYRRHARIS
jgi:hypothetical protein